MTKHSNLLLAVVLTTLSAGTIVAGQARVQELRFETGRPLANAVDQLERRYGWIVTYEDLASVGFDAQDVTGDVRKDHDWNAAQRVLVPVARPFSLIVDEDQATQAGQVGAPAVIASLIDAYNRSGNPGVFRGAAVRTKNNLLVFHLIPTQSRDEHGQSIAYMSPLDARISLSKGKRPTGKVLEEIGQSLTRTTGRHIDPLPAIGSQWLFSNIVEGGADNEIARDVLRRVLIEDQEVPVSWWMFCSPGAKGSCSLNPHGLATVSTTNPHAAK